MVRRAKERGYVAAFTVRRQGSQSFVDPHRIHRIQIYPEMRMDDFVKSLSVFSQETHQVINPRRTRRLGLIAGVLLLAGCAAGPGGSGPASYEALIAPQRERAAALAAQGNLRGASDAWKVALTIDPQDAVALAESRKLDEQIKQSVGDRLSRGRDALKRNVHLEARSHFLAVLALDPGNREAFEALQSQVREVRQVNHTVRAGDSLTSIAQLYYGDRTRSEVIWETNQLPPNPKLTPGTGFENPRDSRLAVRKTGASAGRENSAEW